jgi:hypothetical protein
VLKGSQGLVQRILSLDKRGHVYQALCQEAQGNTEWSTARTYYLDLVDRELG